jgi:hypothetical protein
MLLAEQLPHCESGLCDFVAIMVLNPQLCICGNRQIEMVLDYVASGAIVSLSIRTL